MMDMHQIKKMTEAPDFKADDILEALADIGFAPCLIYDDNGHWALACEGMQTIRADAKDDLEAYVFVRADYFQKTIREAVKYWIEQQVLEK